MAITPASLAVGHFNVGGVSAVNSASVTPVAGKTHIATLVTASGSSANATHSSVTGAGLTWTKILQQATNFGGALRGDISIWQGTGTPSAGAVTFNWSNTLQDAAWWTVEDFSEAPTVRNSASHGGWGTGHTFPFIQLPAVQSPDSLSFGLAWAFSGGGVAAGSGWSTLIDDNFPATGQQLGEYKFNDATVDFDSNDAGFGIAIELAPATGPSVGMIRA